MRPLILVAALAAFILPSVVQAQPATDASAPPAAGMAEADVVVVPVWPKAALPLPAEQPVEASFGLGPIDGVPAHLVAGVTAKGYARKVAVEDKTVGQVLVMSVARGDREEMISAEGLTTQFDAAETSELFPETDLKVKGSKTALIAALERLAAEEEKDDDGEKKAADSVSDNPASAGGGTGNDEAAAYRSPSVAPAAPEEEKDPTIDVRISRDGCQIRIDMAQGKAIVQSKAQTFTDGALSGETGCEDSEVSYPLKKTYASCGPDAVDLGTMTAWPKYSLYYVDGEGGSHAVGDGCVKDEESPYVITEDESQCPVTIDLEGGKAIPQAALVYTNRGNARVEVRGCAPSTKTAPLPLTEAACPARQEGARTFEQSMWTYTRNGVVQQAAPCADTGKSSERTAAGCPIRIDVAQGKAVVQTKERTFTDGALSGETGCEDSDISYPLKKSYATCPTDIVDLATMTAWPQYSLYYTDGAGENQPAGECVKDEEAAYVITEDESRCPIYLDFAEGVAVPQSAFVYTNRNNTVVQVGDGCAPSTRTAPLPMTEDKTACPLRHDFEAGRSHELSMWTYMRDGLTYQAAPCADTGRTFPHEAVRTDAAGDYICPVITNMTTKKATLQSRRRITVDGVARFVTECAPDATQQSILSTTNGCMDVSKWTHDLDAGVSYGQRRWYYKRADGSPEYVTDCESSTTTYAHQEKIVGWQYHDDQLWAYPLTTVTIKVSGTTHTVASSRILPGAPQMTYVREGTINRPTDRHTYEDCDAYRQTEKYERWTRPDDTEYLKLVGAGAPEAPRNACTYSAVWTKKGEVAGWDDGNGWHHYCAYNGARTAHREDGAGFPAGTFSAATILYPYGCKSTHGTAGCVGGLGAIGVPIDPSTGNCSATAPVNLTAGWNSQIGW